MDNYLFDNPQAEFAEFPEVGLLPKYGSLTLWEYQAIEPYLEELRDSLQDPVMAIALEPVLNRFLAGVIILSRGKGWDAERIGLLSPETATAIADFALAERRRWLPVAMPQAESNAAGPEPAAIDWNQVFIRLASALPGDPRWRPDTFAKTPLAHIEAAIATLNKVELQRASMNALPLAMGFTYLLKAQGVKRLEVEDLEPYGRELKIQSEAAQIDPDAARLLKSLIKSGECPPWASNMINPEVLQRAADS